MRLPSLVRFAAGGLWRQKARTALTVLGVAVGAGGLAFSLALGLGLRAYIDREFRGRPQFWVIQIQPGRGAPVPEADIPPDAVAVPGDMSAERKARLRRLKIDQYQSGHRVGPPAKLTPDRLAELAALPGVERVEAWHGHWGPVRAGDGRRRDAHVVSGPLAGLAPRLVAGRLPADDAYESLISENLLYALGADTDAAVAAALGRPLHLSLGGQPPRAADGLATIFGVAAGDLTAVQEQVFDRLAESLPKSLDTLPLSPAERLALDRLLMDAKAKKPQGTPTPAVATVTLVGVVRDLSVAERYAPDSPDPWEARSGEVLLPPAAGGRLFGQLPWVQERGFNSARVQVTPGGDLRAAVDGVTAGGFESHHLLKFYDATRTQVTLTAAGLNLFALLALVVACLGITNTLVTSVVERTREVGMMKAVGATAGQVRRLFLLEGAVIGLAGGLLGLGLALALTGPANTLVHHLIARASPDTPHDRGTVFEWPAWLLLAAVGFAVLTTTLAAWYPARRAARLDPVAALRG